MIGAATRLAQICSVWSSRGKKPELAPNSGVILAMTARSPADSVETPSPIEFDEAIREIDAAKALGHREREIGREHALPQTALKAHADDVRHADHHRHAEEDALGLEPAHAPAEHADAVDHRRVAVGADQGVGHGPRYAVALRGGDDTRQALEIERVHDAGAGRMDADAREGARRPFHEAVALGIAAEFALHVAAERVGRAEHVDGQGMVGRDVDRQHRIEPAGSCPASARDARMPAMSTRAGPQVVSCIITRPGRNGISSSLRPSASQFRIAALRAARRRPLAQDVFQQQPGHPR